MEATKLSSKGQVVLPKAVREQHGWTPGTEFVVESTPDGVRLLVNDDQRQGALARRLFETGDVFIGVTVLLESAWVLESVYELSPGDAAKVLRGLLGLPNVRVEDAGAVAAALDAVGKGLELADALHLLRSPVDAEFVTFDRALAKSGRKVRPVRLV